MGLVCNKLTLVESCHPYGVGWYSDDKDKYITFLVESDKYLKKLF